MFPKLARSSVPFSWSRFLRICVVAARARFCVPFLYPLCFIMLGYLLQNASLFTWIVFCKPVCICARCGAVYVFFLFYSPPRARFPFHVFFNTSGIYRLCAAELPTAKVSAELVNEGHMEAGKFHLGKTKIFLRTTTQRTLDAAREEHVSGSDRSNRFLLTNIIKLVVVVHVHAEVIFIWSSWFGCTPQK